MKDLFLKNSSKEILLKRNFLIKIIQIFIWTVTTYVGAIFLLRMIPYAVHCFRLGFIEYCPWDIKSFILIFIISIRYEFWSTWYWADKRPEGVEDWVKFHNENAAKHQRKFFTFNLHKEGERNPLW